MKQQVVTGQSELLVKIAATDPSHQESNNNSKTSLPMDPSVTIKDEPVDPGNALVLLINYFQCLYMFCQD